MHENDQHLDKIDEEANAMLSENPNVEEEIVDDDETPVSVYDMFEMDKTMEQQGIVLDLGRVGKFKLARAHAGNTEYTQEAVRQGKLIGVKKLQKGNISEEAANLRMARIYGRTIIKGWEGVHNRKMELLPFTVQNAVQLLTDLPELTLTIVRHAGLMENYRKEFVEDAEKN